MNRGTDDVCKMRNFGRPGSSSHSMFTRWLPWLALFLSLGACDLLNERSLKWTEDVKLPDGRVVTLTRYQEFRDASHDPGNYWFEFKHPESAELVRWKSDRDLAPVVLIVAKSKSFLLVSPKWGSSLFRYKCPDPPYFLYRYEGQAWQQVPLVDVPIRELKANVIYSVYDYISEIKKRNNHLPLEVTQSQKRNRKPWIIDFSQMKEQTFGKFCDGPHDYLIKN